MAFFPLFNYTHSHLLSTVDKYEMSTTGWQAIILLYKLWWIKRKMNVYRQCTSIMDCFPTDISCVLCSTACEIKSPILCHRHFCMRINSFFSLRKRLVQFKDKLSPWAWVFPNCELFRVFIRMIQYTYGALYSFDNDLSIAVLTANLIYPQQNRTTNMTRRELLQQWDLK